MVRGLWEQFTAEQSVGTGEKTDIELKVAIFYLYVCFFVIYQEIL